MINSQNIYDLMKRLNLTMEFTKLGTTTVWRYYDNKLIKIK